MNKRCPQKHRYESLPTALDALIDGRARRVDVVRVYKCDHCLGWHTTSQPRLTIRLAFEAAAVAEILGSRRVAPSMRQIPRG